MAFACHKKMSIGKSDLLKSSLAWYFRSWRWLIHLKWMFEESVAQIDPDEMMRCSKVDVSHSMLFNWTASEGWYLCWLDQCRREIRSTYSIFFCSAGYCTWRQCLMIHRIVGTLIVRVESLGCQSWIQLPAWFWQKKGKKTARWIVSSPI